MRTIDNLRYMADQIARNLQVMGPVEAALATADHIDQFWDPRMKAAIFADDWSKLSPIAAAAVAYLATGAHPVPQTPVPEFDEVGRPDAK